MARFAHARVIDRVIDVDRESGPRIDAEARGPRATKPDLLLNGRDGIDADSGIEAAFLLQEPQRLGDDERAHLVVEAAGGGAVPEQGLKLVLERHDVAEIDQRLDFGAGGRADIDPEVL